MKIYRGLGQSFCVYGSPTSLHLAVGCNNENAFEMIEKKLEVDWNYIYQ